MFLTNQDYLSQVATERTAFARQRAEIEADERFQKRELLLAGWIHYLCFDLFIGAWEVRDSQANGIPHLVVIPCLIMTFMLGPIGLLFYFAIRTAKLRNASVA